MIGKHAYVPLALGLMIGPTVAYEIAVHELPRSSITLRGFPLPWNGDALIGSGPPIDVFIVPALVDVVAYMTLCAFVWTRLFRRLETTHTFVRGSVVALVWLYAAFVILIFGVHAFGFRGAWTLWYDDIHHYEALLEVGLGLGI